MCIPYSMARQYLETPQKGVNLAAEKGAYVARRFLSLMVSSSDTWEMNPVLQGTLGMT